MMEAASTFAAQAAEARRSVVIGADRWRIATKLAELWQYRELFYFLIWRDVKVRYAQSILGIGWAMIQPLVPDDHFHDCVRKGGSNQLGRHSVRAVRLYRRWSRGPISRTALTDSSGSLVKEVNMLSKIYFPRLIIPLTSVLGRLIDLAISFALLFVLMAWYRTTPTAWSGHCRSFSHPDDHADRLGVGHVAERAGAPVSRCQVRACRSPSSS